MINQKPIIPGITKTTEILRKTRIGVMGEKPTTSDRTGKSFLDSPKSNPLPQLTGKIYGKNYLWRLWSMQVGAGNTVLCGDISGLWLGAKTFALAPFSVDMEGNVIASSVTITGGSITGTTIAGYLLLSGGTLTGDLILDHAPTLNLEAANKKYVDDLIDSSTYDVLPTIVCNNNEVICNKDEVVYN